jgi:AraC-like DNA-binding protein
LLIANSNTYNILLYLEINEDFIIFMFLLKSVLIMELTYWNNYVENNLFLDNDGFFELPYISNSPELMVESVSRMPISTNHILENSIVTDNITMKGEMRYRALEEGLWILASNISIKQNILAKAMYNPTEVSNYYFLSFAVFEYKYPSDIGKTNFATLLSTTCTFYNPNTEANTFFYEGTVGKLFNIAFDKQWAEKNVLSTYNNKQQELNNFLNNKTGLINWLDIVPEADRLSKEMWDLLKITNAQKTNDIILRKQTKDIIVDFFANALKDDRFKIYEPLKTPDYANVAKADKIILQNLSTRFIGVEAIAKAVNISPTKLKAIFKSIFGFSMLQYHKEKNMLLAKQLIEKSNIQIKNIAITAGFESSGKFSAAFKKRFGLLPSDIRAK